MSKPYTMYKKPIMKGVDSLQTDFSRNIFSTLCFGIYFWITPIGIHLQLKMIIFNDKIESGVDNKFKDEEDRWKKYITKYM